MSAVIDPCPWCGSRKMSWEIPAFSYRGYAFCEDCAACGPEFTVASRADRDRIAADAIRSWNR